MRTKLSRRAAVLKTALATYLWPKLARTDTKINLDACVRDLTARNYKQKMGEVTERVRTACNGKLLAADQALDELPGLVESLPDLDPDDDDEPTEVEAGSFLDGIDEEPDSKLMAWLKANLHPDKIKELTDLPDEKRGAWLQENLTDNQLAEYRQLFGEPDDDEVDTNDEAGPPDFPGKPKTGAMDQSPEASFLSRFGDAARISVSDVPAPIRRKKPSARVAMDQAVQREDDRESFESRFPDAARIG